MSWAPVWVTRECNSCVACSTCGSERSTRGNISEPHVSFVSFCASWSNVLKSILWWTLRIPDWICWRFKPNLKMVNAEIVSIALSPLCHTPTSTTTRNILHLFKYLFLPLIPKFLRNDSDGTNKQTVASMNTIWSCVNVNVAAKN